MADTRRWLDNPVEAGRRAGFGIYLHVPFCAHRCGYCDFATFVPEAVGGQAVIDRYMQAIGREVQRVAAADRPADGWPQVTSVFVGGGTPTLVGGAALASLLGTVATEFTIADACEVTVEANPENASVELFSTLASAGVNRVSLGAQSFAPHVLKILERGHDEDRPVEAVRQARDGGIDQVSVDLIFGTPGERNEDWARSLEVAVASGVDHISAYALTIHDNTSFGRAVSSGAMTATDDDLQRDRFDVAHELLSGVGFEHYEVSNWARGTRARSQHNTLYWRHGDYLAFGVGAHGHLDGRRWWNTRSVPTYLGAVEGGGSPVAGREVLDDEERAEERLMLGLRVREGLHPTDAPPIDPLALADAIDCGLVTTSCGRLQCTEDGWFLLDEAVRRLG